MQNYKDGQATIFGDAGSPRQSVPDSRNRRLAPGGWTFTLALAGVTCCLGQAVPAGFNIGVMNNAAHLMQSFCNESIRERYGAQLSNNGLKILWSGVVSIFLIGGVSGSFMASRLADKYGRKGAMNAGNIFGIIGGCLFFLVRELNSVEVLLLARLIIGFSGGFATSLVSMYMSEVAPLRLRGAVGVLCQLGLTCGVFLGQIAGLDSVLGTTDSWQYMLGSFVPLCVFGLIVTIFFLPESPKFLFIMKEQKERALNELTRIRNMDIILLQSEVEDLQQEVELKTSADPWSIARIIKDPTLTLPLFLVCTIQMGQQLSGINVVFYYSRSIFLNAGLGETGSQYATLGTGVANMLTAVISVVVMSAFNRRKTLLISIYLCFICMITLCISTLFIDAASFMPWLSTIAMLAYVTFYGLGVGPIPYFIGSELFEVGPRPIAMALGSGFNWGGNFLVGMMFPSLESAIGAYSFLVFSGFLLIMGQIVRIYLPETRGRSTTEVAAMITQGFSSRPNAMRE